MYGVVLMAALATSSTAPDCHRGWGGGSGGCYGSSYGCYGGGCYGGCYGSGYAAGYGCYGSGYGCSGSGYGSGYGCYGSGYGSGYGCSGGVWGCYGSSGYGGFSYGCGGCYGCYGGYAGYGVNPTPVYGDSMMAPGSMSMPAAPSGTMPTIPAKQPEIAPPPAGGKGQQSRVKVRIDVPAEAKLFIDGQLMRTGSTTRVFQTPDLNPSQTYFYDLRVELNRDGQTLTETQRVIVRPGRDVSASFAGMEQRASETATVQRD